MATHEVLSQSTALSWQGLDNTNRTLADALAFHAPPVDGLVDLVLERKAATRRCRRRWRPGRRARYAPDLVFDAYCRSRCAGNGSWAFGARPAGVDFDFIIHRAMPH